MNVAQKTTPDMESVEGAKLENAVCHEQHNTGGSGSQGGEAGGANTQHTSGLPDVKPEDVKPVELPRTPQFRFEEATWNLRGAEKREKEARDLFHRQCGGMLNQAAREMFRKPLDEAEADTKHWRQKLAEAEADLKIEAEEEHARWLENLTPEDVPTLEPGDLFNLSPDLLVHVTLDQVNQLSRAQRDQFSPEQAAALADRFAEAHERKMALERERQEKRRIEAEKKRVAELEDLLCELEIVPVGDDDEDGPATPMLFENWIPDFRPTLIHAPKAAGKTTTMGGLVLSMSSGETIFPSLNPTRGPMNGIVVLAEDTRAEFNAILDTYSEQSGVYPVGQILPWETEGPLMVNNGGGWEPSEMLEQLEALIRKSRARYVVLDHLGMLAGDLDTDSKKDMTALWRTLTRISRDLSVAILLTTHTKDGGIYPAGSVYLRNLPRCILRISATTKGALLHQQYFNYRATMPSIQLERVGAAFCEITPQDVTEAQGETQAGDQVGAGALLLQWLRDNPEAQVTADNLRTGTGADAKDLIDHMRQHIPEIRNSEAVAAAQALIDSGQLVQVETVISRRKRLRLTPAEPA